MRASCLPARSEASGRAESYVRVLTHNLMILQLQLRGLCTEQIHPSAHAVLYSFGQIHVSVQSPMSGKKGGNPQISTDCHS